MNTIVVDFRQIESEDDLAFVIGTDGTLVRAYLACKEKFLTRHRLPKRGGRGFRDVLQVRFLDVADCFKSLSGHLAGFFADLWKGFPHAGVHGYVPRRSIRTNAEAHRGATKLVRADIQKFFPSVGRSRLESFFQTLGCKPGGAFVLADFLTVDDALPLGLSTSPVVANAVCRELDVELATLAPGGVYTRYADDITFSGPQLPTKFALKNALSRHGFVLNERKFRVQHRGRGMYVTGLSIEDPAAPHVPRAFKRKLRQELRFAKRFGLEDHFGMAGYDSTQSGVNKITGRIQYLRGIERGFGDRMLAQWNEVLKEADAKPTFVTRHEIAPRDVSMFIDEAESPASKQPFFALACVVAEDLTVLRRRLAAFLQQLKLDPYTSGRKKTLETKGLHWSDLTEEPRGELVKLLAQLPVRVFTAFVRAPKGMTRDDYEALYVKLARFLVSPRLSRYDRARVKIVAEENSKVSAAKLTAEIGAVYAGLASANARRPTMLDVSVAGKLDEPCLALADAFLAILVEYATTAESEQLYSVRWRRFERIRQKLRLIYDADTHTAFSRRNLFFRNNADPISSPARS